jgi:double-stranded uracil-DNA glycosylase
MLVESFAPVVSAQSRVLVLGSMPGVASLTAQQYYAHPRNAFWPIMAQVVGIDLAADYAKRLQQLRERGIALWDVIGHCERPGSLDTAIVAGSVHCNNFDWLFRAYPQIHTVFFNGKSVETLFRRHVLPCIDEKLLPLQRICLPSTSPANARLDLAAKTSAWLVLRSALQSER